MHYNFDEEINRWGGILYMEWSIWHLWDFCLLSSLLWLVWLAASSANGSMATSGR